MHMGSLVFGEFRNDKNGTTLINYDMCYLAMRIGICRCQCLMHFWFFADCYIDEEYNLARTFCLYKNIEKKNEKQKEYQ